MSQKTDAELTTDAEVIRDETTPLANTKTRVYNNLKNVIDSKPNNSTAYTWPFPQVTASGTDTYTATLSPVITAYAAGQKFQILFTNANTGAATLNLNALGAKAIRKNGATALASGDISAGQILLLGYDGTNLQIIGGGGSGGGGGAVDSVNSQTGVVVLDAGDIGFTPAGTISATDTQAAIAELDSENQTAHNLKLDSLVTLRTETATHDLDATDLANVNAGNQLVIVINVGVPVDLEIPTNANQAFPTGTVIGWMQYGVGQITIVPLSGVTLRAPNAANKSYGQYSRGYIQKIGTNEWLLSGDITV